MSYSLGHSISDTTQNDCEVRVNAVSQLGNQDLIRVGYLHVVFLWLNERCWERCAYRNNVGSVTNVIQIVGEEVALLSINDLLNDVLRVVTLNLHKPANHLSEFINEHWKSIIDDKLKGKSRLSIPVEELLNELDGGLFKIRVDTVD